MTRETESVIAAYAPRNTVASKAGPGEGGQAWTAMFKGGEEEEELLQEIATEGDEWIAFIDEEGKRMFTANRKGTGYHQHEGRKLNNYVKKRGIHPAHISEKNTEDSKQSILGI